ncbi:MAG: helix-turn-helix transcriptional regulator [Nodosilinea sp.]
MIESREDFPNQRIQLHDEIDIEGQCCVHLTGDWVDWGEAETTYLLISIENLWEVTAQRAAFDAYRYQLTARESDVWRLAMQGCSYSEIAEQLFISVNTVKRHMKSIHEKRRR